MPASNATSRFSDRVENYVRYRPGYPAEAFAGLKSECGLTASHVIADIASRHWDLDSHAAGERQSASSESSPMPRMRQAGERLLADFRVHQRCGHS